MVLSNNLNSISLTFQSLLFFLPDPSCRLRMSSLLTKMTINIRTMLLPPLPAGLQGPVILADQGGVVPDVFIVSILGVK